VFSELTVGKVNEHVSELHDWLAPLKRIGPTFLSDAPTVTELVAQIRQYSDEVADMPKGLVTVLRVLHYITVAPPTSDIGCESSAVSLFTRIGLFLLDLNYLKVGYLRCLLGYYTPSRSLRSANTNLLSVPHVHTTSASRGFSIWNSVPSSIHDSSFMHTCSCRTRLWNSLPPHLRDAGLPYSRFRRSLVRHFKDASLETCLNCVWVICTFLFSCRADVCISDQTEELRYKYAIVELFGAGCLPLFTSILQVYNYIFLVFSWPP